MLTRLVIVLTLLAATARAGVTNTGGGGSLPSGLTPQRCLRTDVSGAVVVATGDCAAGDSAGTTAAFSGITNGEATGKTFTIGPGSTLSPNGGSIDATFAQGAGVLDDLDNGGTDPAISEIAVQRSLSCGYTPVSVTGGKLLIDTTQPWCAPIQASQIAGTLDVSQVPQAGQALSAISNPPACAAHKFVTKNPQSFAQAPTCTQPAFDDIASVLAENQLPTTNVAAVGACGPLCTINSDQYGRVTSKTPGALTANSVGPNEIDETVNYRFLILSGKQRRNVDAVSDQDCTGEQGSWWYDTGVQRFSFCDQNSGAPRFVGSLDDGDKGDITVTNGSTWTIDADAVTYAKMQNVTQDKLIGRATASTGDPEEIACDAQCRALLDDTSAAAQRATVGANGEHWDIAWNNPAATDDILIGKVSRTTTPTSLDCVAQGGSGLTTIDVSIEECDANGASCVGIGGSVTMTAVSTNASDSVFTDTTLTAGNWLRAVIGTETWTTPGFLSCTLKGTF